VLVQTAGHNALDFHIAYHIGALSAHDPSAVFHIISKDEGFDSLLLHLKQKGIAAHRSHSIATIPAKAELPDVEGQIRIAVNDLTRRGATRPRTKKTLLSTLHALFKRQMTEPQLLVLLEALCRQGIVLLDGPKATYNLPVEGNASKPT